VLQTEKNTILSRRRKIMKGKLILGGLGLLVVVVVVLAIWNSLSGGGLLGGNGFTTQDITI